MQSGGQDLVQQLHAAFPAERIRGDAAFAQWGASYPDAVAYRQAIDGKTWEELDARYIVVGTREAGLRGSVREFFNGSVAVHLAHRQHRPVIVVPLAPIEGGEKLPWEDPPV